MSVNIKIFDGQAFIETTVEAGNVSQLKAELQAGHSINGRDFPYPEGAVFSLNGNSAVGGKRQLEDGDFVAVIVKDKTGGIGR